MAIYLGGETAAAKPKLDELTPRQIVEELDRYVVGQTDAKRAVAVALRNRIRRQKLPPEIAEDVLPKNILMIGTTGVGKTEIARRLARIADSPFIKIEASKFTEVGYVGRDVESMIRELTDVAVDMAKQAAYEDVKPRAQENAEERLLDILLPPTYTSYSTDQAATDESAGSKTREKLRGQLRRGDLDGRLIEMDTQERPNAQIDFIAGQGMEEMGMNLQGMLGNMFPSKTVRRKMKVAEARDYLIREEQEALVDIEQITRSAIQKTQDSGIVFLDEIDKVAGRETGNSGGSPDVSREGVQRDLLPIVEGTNVNTRYGMVNTEHILFIAAGAFHVSKPSDLIPELQGRFPIRVELESLTVDDLKRILTQPKNSLIKQYQALLSTEGIELKFTDDAISRLAEMTAEINKLTENIGARRLHTLLEKLLEEISFAGAELENKQQIIDENYVSDRLSTLVKDQDLRQYIL